MRCRYVLPLAFLALVNPFLEVPASAQQKAKLPRPRQLDSGIVWRRDPATGDLSSGPINNSNPENGSNTSSGGTAIRVSTQIVPVTCSVFASDGTAITGLARADFRVYDDGFEQPISYFDISSEPASVALVIDASPSVLRDSDEMKRAARALIEGLSPADQVAVVDFAAHTFLQLSFLSDRDLIRRALGRVDVRQLLGDTGGSNIYEAVYLTAGKVFLRGREGRKSVVLFTDGQDSGLGLTLDPASAAPQPGKAGDRLTFEDVVRTLAGENIQVFVVSTENRPRVMSVSWLAARNGTTLITNDARNSGIPAYTLYLAELVRRSGGQLYFLRESASLAGIFRRIAQQIGTQYTLGFYPATSLAASGHASWHQLHVEVSGHPGASVIHRAAYYARPSQ
ncbi:MAG: VWA domain-containing protein [Candidatus Acidiferrales bacterium]